jgi:hypothetical protein
MILHLWEQSVANSDRFQSLYSEEKGSRLKESRIIEDKKLKSTLDIRELTKSHAAVEKTLTDHMQSLEHLIEGKEKEIETLKVKLQQLATKKRATSTALDTNHIHRLQCENVYLRKHVQHRKALVEEMEGKTHADNAILMQAKMELLRLKRQALGAELEPERTVIAEEGEI